MRCLANALTWRYSELSHRASRVHPLLTLAALPSDWSLALLRRSRRPPARMLCTFIRTWLCTLTRTPTPGCVYPMVRWRTIAWAQDGENLHQDRYDCRSGLQTA